MSVLGLRCRRQNFPFDSHVDSETKLYFVKFNLLSRLVVMIRQTGIKWAFWFNLFWNSINIINLNPNLKHTKRQHLLYKAQSFLKIKLSMHKFLNIVFWMMIVWQKMIFSSIKTLFLPVASSLEDSDSLVVIDRHAGVAVDGKDLKIEKKLIWFK